MLHELTPEQAAKLARLWQWRAGQQGIGYVELSDGRRLHALWRIVEVRDDRPFVWSFDEDCALPLRGAAPTLDDDTTRDGLLRTCRKAWMDDAFAMRSLSGKWKVYVRSGLEEHVFEGATEDAALLAAILAAPEAT